MAAILFGHAPCPRSFPVWGYSSMRRASANYIQLPCLIISYKFFSPSSYHLCVRMNEWRNHVRYYALLHVWCTKAHSARMHVIMQWPITWRRSGCKRLVPVNICIYMYSCACVRATHCVSYMRVRIMYNTDNMCLCSVRESLPQQSPRET